MKKKARAGKWKAVRDGAFSLKGTLPNFEKLTFGGRPDDWFVTPVLAEFLRKRLAKLLPAYSSRIRKKDWFGPSRETLLVGPLKKGKGLRPTCQSCRWLRVGRAVDPTDQCRRHSPAYENEEHSAGRIAVWPPVDCRYDWCGDYERGKKQEPYHALDAQN